MNDPRVWVATAVVVATILAAALLAGRGTSENRLAASEVESDPPASTALRGEDSRRGADLPTSPETATGPVPVEIDVLPHTEVNVIDLDTEMPIPVAVLSADRFDAPAEISRPLLRFGRTGREASPAGCEGAQDVNGDGLPDLVCRFRARLAGLEVGDTEGILTGETRGMLAIHGSDSVTVVDRRWDRSAGAPRESR